MKVDTRLAFISLLVGIGSLVVGIKQCQLAEQPSNSTKENNNTNGKTETEQAEIKSPEKQVYKPESTQAKANPLKISESIKNSKIQLQPSNQSPQKNANEENNSNSNPEPLNKIENTQKAYIKYNTGEKLMIVKTTTNPNSRYEPPIQEGAEIVVVQRVNEWYEIKYTSTGRQYQGWVEQKYVEFK